MIAKTLLCFLVLAVSVRAAYYSVDSNLVIKEIQPNEAENMLDNPEISAVAQFIDDRNVSGWSYYYIQTSNAFPDWFQTYTAGYTEGYLSWYEIYDMANDQEIFVANLTQNVTGFIYSQMEWMVEMVYANPDDDYWNLVNATLAQLYGMYAGYLAAIVENNRTDLNISFNEFYMISYASDLGDVQGKFVGFTPQVVSRCSYLLKLTNDSLIGSHETWSDYNSLLKSYKVLTFDLHNPLVQTKTIAYSGQPGSIPSQDDFYILDHNHFVAETTISNNNPEVYSWIHYDSVPYWVRITVANWVFDTQQTWIDTYFRYRSGTYNNQWQLVDFNAYYLYKDNLTAAQDIIWIAEEFYSLTSTQDMTQELLIPQGYYASYNVPYNATLQELSQDTTNYTTDPRYFLFKKYAPGIQNLEDFQFVMRLNNISDTGDYCEAIASRCDLNDTTTYPWGAIDCKVTTDTLVTNHQAWIILGPTQEVNNPMFTWADWPQYSADIGGMPTSYNFSWVFSDPNNNFSVVPPTDNVMSSEAYILAY